MSGPTLKWYLKISNNKQLALPISSFPSIFALYQVKHGDEGTICDRSFYFGGPVDVIRYKRWAVLWDNYWKGVSTVPCILWDPFHKRFFHHNSNLMEISLSSNSITDGHIATKFGTCHDSPAVVLCAKCCSDHFISFWMRAKWNFHHIWIVMEKLLVKWAPDQQPICESGK